MKRKKHIIEGLLQYPYFDKETLKTEAIRFGLSSHSVDAYLKSREIARLKNGFYVHQARLKEDKADLSYIFHIANKLKTPSYISLESALQFYGLMTETVNTVVSSVTFKTTKQYNTPLGKFTYRSIKEDLFHSYETFTKGRYRFLMATNFKCLFDYLYFYTDRFRKSVDVSIFDVLRLDVQDLSQRDKTEFNKLMSSHTHSEIRL